MLRPSDIRTVFFPELQIIENKNSALNFSDYLERLYADTGTVTDDRITDNADTVKRLNFSDRMNNGGT